MKKVNAIQLTPGGFRHPGGRNIFIHKASGIESETVLSGGWSKDARTMKIYVRERQKVGTGVHQPRFRVVAVVGEGSAHAKIEAVHFRKTELEQVAKDIEAEIVYLEAMPEEERGAMMEAKA